MKVKFYAVSWAVGRELSSRIFSDVEAAKAFCLDLINRGLQYHVDPPCELQYLTPVCDFDQTKIDLLLKNAQKTTP